jgi:hypothetical protein
MERKSLKEYFFKVCPKTKRIRGVRTDTALSKVFFVFTVLMAIGWVLIRSIPKPSRLSYACQQVSVGYIVSFFSMVFGITFFRAAIKKIPPFLKQPQFKALTLIIGLFAGAFAFFIASGANWDVLAQQWDPGYQKNTGKFDNSGTLNMSKEAPANQSVGITSANIVPGRVAWSHIPGAANWNGQGNWYDDNQNDQKKIDTLLLGSIYAVANTTNLDTAWYRLFSAVNTRNGKLNKGYSPGEKIAVKVNGNNRGAQNNMCDATPQLVYSLIAQLVKVKVQQQDIVIYEAGPSDRDQATNYIRNYCTSSGRPQAYPNVIYQRNDRQPDAINYSNSGANAPNARKLAKAAIEATYMINMALLKKGLGPQDRWEEKYGQTGCTMCAKNHFGSIEGPSDLHPTVKDWLSPSGQGRYNPVVDLSSHPHLGGKTILYILDGLYTGDRWDSGVKKWRMQPFNGNYPSSVFASQDIVAIESVGFDFLRTEWELPQNSDNYLHEMAQIGNPPSRTTYTYANRYSNGSMGVHEHWNGADTSKMKYSRNLNPATGKGIELFKVPRDLSKIVPTTIVDYQTTPKGNNQNLSIRVIAEGSRKIIGVNVSGNYTLDLYTANGSRVRQFKGNAATQIALNGIAAGNYYAVVKSKDMISSANIIIPR